MTVHKSILQSICNAAAYNQHELAGPRVIVWPDEEKLWSQCIAPLRTSYPVLWSLGDYCPEHVCLDSGVHLKPIVNIFGLKY